MLTKTEARGCKDILNKLDPDDIISLKDTVTNRQIAVEGWQEAITVIITYSETARSLLKRKKLTRDCLFQYLHECGVIVSPNIEKSRLVDKILEYWNPGGETPSHEVINLEDTSSNSGSSYTARSSSSSHSGDSQRNQSISLPSSLDLESVSDNLSLDLNDNCNDVSFYAEQTTSVAIGNKATSSVNYRKETNIDVRNQHDQTLAETFVTWFYKMLNSNNPSMNETPQDFGPQHFWNDVKLSLITNDVNHVDEFEGSEIVCQRFLALMKEELLLFNPNVGNDGVKCQKDPHGLVLISVCGTVHRHNDCLGTFQQLFGIIRDPRFDNNWKIKTTKLGIRASSVQNVPKLAYNCDMLSIASA